MSEKPRGEEQVATMCRKIGFISIEMLISVPASGSPLSASNKSTSVTEIVLSETDLFLTQV